MSLVGPRPERPELQKEIEKEVPEFGLRLQTTIDLQKMSTTQAIECTLSEIAAYRQREQTVR